MDEITVKSTLDETMQPSLFRPAKKAHRPLLVGLHTWSCDRFNQVENMLPIAEREDWNLLLPEFRGSNTESNCNADKACGSVYAKQDIIDAVNYVKDNFNTDKKNIYLLGASGGGHMALLMAAYAPDMWKAVDAWVPITNLTDWYYQCLKSKVKYALNLEACCGGAPCDRTASEYAYRSPVTHVRELTKVTLRINHGKTDPIVPFTHSINIYSKLLEYNSKTKAYLNIFDGGHEMNVNYAAEWFKSRSSTSKGKQVTG